MERELKNTLITGSIFSAGLLLYGIGTSSKNPVMHYPFHTYIEINLSGLYKGLEFLGIGLAAIGGILFGITTAYYVYSLYRRRLLGQQTNITNASRYNLSRIGERINDTTESLYNTSFGSRYARGTDSRQNE